MKLALKLVKIKKKIDLSIVLEPWPVLNRIEYFLLSVLLYFLMIYINHFILYRVFFKFGVFSNILRYIPDSGLSRFPLGVSECTQGRSNTSTAAELAEFRKITTF